MKRLAIIIGLAVVFPGAGITGVAAETRPGAFTVTPMVGGYVFEGNQDIEKNPLFGIGLGYDFSRYFGAEAVFNYVDTEYENLDNDIDVYVYHLDGLLYFLPTKNFTPYLAAGVGGISFDPEDQGSETDFLVNYGLGLKYFLTDNLAARADVRHLISFDDTHHNLAYAVGLTYHFGGERPVEEVKAAPAPPPPAKIAAPAPPPRREVCVYLNVYFDFDRAEVKSDYHEDLRKVADFMKANPETKATIKGHTDYIGTEEYNQQLSERRAQSIKSYLVENFDLDARRLTAVGFGESKPMATNETDYGRQLNRRGTEVLCTFEIVFE